MESKSFFTTEGTEFTENVYHSVFSVYSVVYFPFVFPARARGG